MSKKSRSYQKIKKTHLPKTIYFHLEEDADIIAWFQDARPNASEAVRRVLRLYIQSERPELAGGPAVAIDPAQVRQVVEEVMAEQMGQIRPIVQAAIDTAMAGRVIGGPALPAANGNGNGNGRAVSVLDRLALAFDDDDI